MSLLGMFSYVFALFIFDYCCALFAASPKHLLEFKVVTLVPRFVIVVQWPLVCVLWDCLSFMFMLIRLSVSDLRRITDHFYHCNIYWLRSF